MFLSNFGTVLGTEMTFLVLLLITKQRVAIVNKCLSLFGVCRVHRHETHTHIISSVTFNNYVRTLFPGFLKALNIFQMNIVVNSYVIKNLKSLKEDFSKYVFFKRCSLL